MKKLKPSKWAELSLAEPNNGLVNYKDLDSKSNNEALKFRPYRRVDNKLVFRTEPSHKIEPSRRTELSLGAE